MSALSEGFWHGKRVFITGHTGFKGAWLAFWLQSRGAEVYGYALPPETQPDLFSVLDLAASIHHHEGDIRDGVALTAALKESNPDVVFHLAAQALVPRAFTQPIDTISANVMGTAQLLEACRSQSTIRAIVIATTDKCYEMPDGNPRKETDALGGHEPYSASKACAEIIVDAYRRSYFAEGAAIATVRAGNVLGGGDWHEGRLIPDTIRALQKGKMLTLRHPLSVRPWQHVFDCLSGYLLVAEELWNSPKIASRPWNIGPEALEGVTAFSLAQQLAEVMKKNLVWQKEENTHFTETAKLQLDSVDICRLLGYASKLDISQTVKMTADWYSHFESHGAKSMPAFSRAQLETFAQA